MSYFSDMMTGYFNSPAEPVDPYAAFGDATVGRLTPAGYPDDEPLSTKLGRFWRNDRAPSAAPPPSPPPPPTPGPADMPRVYGPTPMPITPRLEGGDPTGAKRTLARLADPQPIQAPPGVEGNASDYIRLAVGGQPGSTPWTNGQIPAQGGAPRAMPGISNAPPAAAAAQRPAAQPIGAGIESHIPELRQMFKWPEPASAAPDFHDKLLRFGLAAMAAGGKPMATTLGALGEAGLSTVDATQKAKQGDFENTLNTRKLAVHAQELISKAYEKLDTLKQHAEAAGATAEDKRAYQVAQREVQLLIATMNNQTRQDAIAAQTEGKDAANEARQEANRIREGDVAGRAADREIAAGDRAARTAETANQHAAGFYSRRMEAAAKANPLGPTSEIEAKVTKETAAAHPNSVYVQQWDALKTTALDDARRFIAAHPTERPKAIEMLRRSGIDPRGL